MITDKDPPLKSGTHSPFTKPNTLTRMLTKLYSVPSRGHRLDAMEGLRAYAVLAVFFVHYSWGFARHEWGIDLNQVSIFQLLDQEPKAAPLFWAFSSHYGVDLFFLISGYLIAKMVRKADFRFGLFFWRRILRIYPVLIISTFVYVGFNEYIGAADYSVRTIIANLFLLNGIPGLNIEAINTPTWSLFFEFAFYASFPIIWKLSRGRLWVVWLLSGLVLLPLFPVSNWYVRFLMFLAGVSLQVLPSETLSRWRAQVSEPVVIVAYLLSTTLFVFIKNPGVYIPVYLLGASLLVDSALHREGFLQWLFSRPWIRYLGNVSFSFYLFHILSLIMSHVLLDRLGLVNSSLFELLHLLVALSITLALATLSFALVEKRYFRRQQ